MELRKRARGESSRGREGDPDAAADHKQRRARPIKNIVLSLNDSDFGGVEWYSSHIDPDVILWSSEPNVHLRVVVWLYEFCFTIE